MTVKIAVAGEAAATVDAVLGGLVSAGLASKIAAKDATVWGADAHSEAEVRLGWVDCVTVSAPLVPQILQLRSELVARGVNHFVLGGMGGSSLAPEVITLTAGVELTVLDSTAPGQILAALGDRLSSTAVVISSKSGSTLETDSQKRAYEFAFRAVGIEPTERIIIVTDPGSPLDQAARADGYRVFNADPHVGGRYSALTAFGLVPSGLAGADIAGLLADAESVLAQVGADSAENPALVLAATMAGNPAKLKLGIVADGTSIVGFPDWAEQLIAESTGKLGKGVLPVVLDASSPEIDEKLADLQIVRLVADAHSASENDLTISGPLGAQMVVWEFAVAVAGQILGINPFDQPDVESAKAAARGLLENRPETVPADFSSEGIEVRAKGDFLAGSNSISTALDALLGQIPADGYLSVQAYVDRLALPELVDLRDLLAARSGRPVTFGWAPRFLHSTGQYHKGGPANGVFLQITEDTTEDLAIPDRPFTFGQLIKAQAAGDATVLAEHGRPILTLNLTDAQSGAAALLSAAR